MVGTPHPNSFAYGKLTSIPTLNTYLPSINTFHPLFLSFVNFPISSREQYYIAVVSRFIQLSFLFLLVVLEVCCYTMDMLFRGLNDEASFSQLDMRRCPFLRNIDEPTSFSFSPSSACSMPARGSRGPIFEDGPNFELAFRLFHGHDGVVPLSGRSFVQSEKSETQPAQPALPEFNPLAAKAATISLSFFGHGGPFSFDAFSKKWKNEKGKSKSRKSSQGGRDSRHEALSNEWLEKGNCPIAKSYRAVKNVLPLVAKSLQPPPGMNLRCPPAIVAARAALARTALAKNLRPQPLPAKVMAIGVLGIAANIPLGAWREHTEKYSPSWFIAIHAAVPFIAMLRKSVLMPKSAMAFTIAASILGQVIGSRAERFRLKAIAARELSVVEVAVGRSGKMEEVVGVKGGDCDCGGEIVEWEGIPPLQVVSRPSAVDVFG